MERAAEAVTTNEMEAQIIDRKGEALAEFVRRLRASPAADRIAQIVLYGSYARGEAGPESDVDVLILTAGPVEEVRWAAAEIAGDLMVELSERVETMVYTWEKAANDPSPFLYRVLREGQGVYRMPNDEQKHNEIETLYRLAGIYFRTAGLLAQVDEEGARRGAIDLGYNAIELSTKAFLRDVMETLPRTHGGIQKMFSDRYIKVGKFPHAFAHDLGVSLDLRHSARYDGNATITSDMVRHVLRTAEQMLTRLAEHLASSAMATAPADEGNSESS